MDVSVSVIIPTHNRQDLLYKAVKSVLNQTFQDFEIIVVNDASTDDTVAMLSKLQRFDRRLQIISNPKPLGGAESRNMGIAASRGKWIAFLDDDDSWLPQKLAKQLQALAHKREAIACSCAYRVNYPLGIKRVTYTPHLIEPERLLQSNELGGASVCMAKTSVLKQMGGLDKKLRSSQDWDLWVRLSEQGPIISVGEILVDYQVHFNYRISNDMRAKYYGARRFYLKHKNKMSKEARHANLSFICFIQSREAKRPLSSRLKKLLMAVKYSSSKIGLRYVVSSFPRLVLGAVDRKAQ